MQIKAELIKIDDIFHKFGELFANDEKLDLVLLSISNLLDLEVEKLVLKIPEKCPQSSEGLGRIFERIKFFTDFGQKNF